MNEKEIAEIRRRFRHDKSNITKIRGCYVNDKKEIISEFNKSLGLMLQEEKESLLKIMKKTLSGALGKNLIDIEFSTQQVSDSDEHRLLMELRNSSLENEDCVKSLYEKIISTVTIDGNYLILLAMDKYDVPFVAKDGEEQEDSSEEMFSYYLCCICPIKQTKSALGYHAYENEFKTIGEDYVVSSPELGFMFPSFDDRSANIYNALYYTRNTSENHKEFVDSVFNTEIPLPAAVQKETFQNILAEAIEDDCNYDFVQSVHTKLTEIIDEYKNNKEEPLVLTKRTVKGVLESCGASEEHISSFDEKYDMQFGADAEISPINLVDTKHFEVRTPDVTVQVKPERSYMVETRIIDGVKYIMIRAEEGVEVNGVSIHFDDENNE